MRSAALALVVAFAVIGPVAEITSDPPCRNAELVIEVCRLT